MEEYVEQDDEDVEEDTNEDTLDKFSLIIFKKLDSLWIFSDGLGTKRKMTPRKEKKVDLEILILKSMIL